MTKAAVGVAVGRAAATVSEERGLPPPKRPPFPGGEATTPGAKRKAFASLLSSLLTFLRADDDDLTAQQRKVRTGLDIFGKRGDGVGRGAIAVTIIIPLDVF